MRTLLFSVALSLLPALVGAEVHPVPGQIVDPMPVNEEQSYALYLPSAYNAQVKWPILYCFDARGRGKDVAENFRTAAEQYGYIVASSNNTRSDDPSWPNAQIISALWAITHRHFNIDERRVYLAGFSGGARMAWTLGFLQKGEVAGVIGCGAGMNPEMPPVKEMPFAFVGAVGNLDFNYYEMVSLAERLQALDAPYRLEIFEGSHQWFPPDVALRAIEFIQIRAYRSGTLPADPKQIATLYAAELSRAQAAEQAGRFLEELDRYRGMARDFAGLTDTTVVQEKADKLQKTREVRDARKSRDRQIKKHDDYVKRLEEVFQRILHPVQEGPVIAARLAQQLQVSELRRKSLEDTEEGLAARRMLAEVLVQTSFYVPTELQKRGDNRTAATVLEVAAQIKPDSPNIWYNLGCAYARMHDLSRALDNLERSVQTGFRNADWMEADEDLRLLRSEPRFKKLIAGIRASQE
jgi:tetratricopeptide (TPR) repeat protein